MSHKLVSDSLLHSTAIEQDTKLKGSNDNHRHIRHCGNQVDELSQTHSSFRPKQNLVNRMNISVIKSRRERLVKPKQMGSPS